ncbi:C-C motif chemokine 13-like [Micropterus dolomieu]|uniref:C-C motif chemokine 13-like n=1 Tax=Micropterus dolomieu TaxID=147949 RepID=UPI001E8EABAE|nr:C-C motif chemokine 13-like [Micropterus dolomieu]
MRFSLGVAALLCFTTWMSVVHATHGPVSICCMQWSNTQVPLKRIVDYTIQSEGVCPIAAVMFQTKLGKRICSDPNSDWAKEAIRKVDEEKKKKTLLEKRLNEDRSTSDMTPAASTTSKNGPQKKTRNGRRRQRNNSRRGRKEQRNCV